MRVLVAGSVPAHLVPGSIAPHEELQSFFQACYRIGQELARARCRVVLGSNRTTTADHHVMRGLQSVPGTHHVTIVRPFEDAHTNKEGYSQSIDPGFHTAVPPRAEAELPPGNLKITYVPIRGPWGVGRITQLVRCDVVMVIGGGKGTRTLIELAPELRRPIVVIPSFGGSAGEAWNTLVRDYGNLGAAVSDYFSLLGPWRDEHAKTAIAMARRLANRNPYEDGAWKQFVYMSMGILGLFVAWALIFSYPCSWWAGGSPNVCSNDRPTMFVLFWIAALIGTGLRAAKRAADDPTERMSAVDLFVEGSIGLSVSFGLSLIYMAGLFLAANNSDLFPLLSEEPGDFRRTAVLMSTISFTSAFLLEGSFAKLQDRLRERVLDEK